LSINRELGRNKGEPEFLEPSKPRMQIFHQRRPWRLRWVDKYHADVNHVACGSGFSLFSISGSSEHRTGHHELFGMGMNTQSQIGVHEENKKHLKYIIRPAKIDLPFNLSDSSNSSNRLKILDVSCGRAHSVVRF
jgi:hypothetical protein